MTYQKNGNIDYLSLSLVPWLLLSLRFGLMPFYYTGLSEASYWILALGTMLGIFCSLAIYEQVRRPLWSARSLPDTGFRIDFLGTSPPMDPGGFGAWPEWQIDSLRMASGGGLGLLFAGGCYLSEALFGSAGLITYVFFHVACANLSWAAFQAIPALPLDGGRLLMQIVSRSGHPSRRTIARLIRLGGAMAIGLGAIGAYASLKEKSVSGAWLISLSLLLWLKNRSERRRLLEDER